MYHGTYILLYISKRQLEVVCVELSSLNLTKQCMPSSLPVPLMALNDY